MCLEKPCHDWPKRPSGQENTTNTSLASSCGTWHFQAFSSSWWTVSDWWLPMGVRVCDCLMLIRWWAVINQITEHGPLQQASSSGLRVNTNAGTEHSGNRNTQLILSSLTLLRLWNLNLPTVTTKTTSWDCEAGYFTTASYLDWTVALEALH